LLARPSSWTRWSLRPIGLEGITDQAAESGKGSAVLAEGL
jgi:hypothetical protein